MTRLFAHQDHLPRSIIPALDCSVYKAVEICRSLVHVKGVQAVKLGSWKGVLWRGLDFWREQIEDATEGYVSLIYDHQKGATDIPDLEDAMAKFAGVVDAVILFPFGGSETQRRWTSALQESGVTPIVGGHMTQKAFLASEGGYIADDAPERIYRLAVEQGVRDFVVPGNKPELVSKYREIIENELGNQGVQADPFDLFAPGFVTQGGEISEAGKAAGPRFHAIVGRDILNADEPAEAARRLGSQLTA